MMSMPTSPVALSRVKPMSNSCCPGAQATAYNRHGQTASHADADEMRVSARVPVRLAKRSPWWLLCERATLATTLRPRSSTWLCTCLRVNLARRRRRQRKKECGGARISLPFRNQTLRCS